MCDVMSCHVVGTLRKHEVMVSFSLGVHEGYGEHVLYREVSRRCGGNEHESELILFQLTVTLTNLHNNNNNNNKMFE